ncbi:3beta-hydroxysteroid-dehydrogenase/decarboxylase [Ipomoea triloba]|uniref:3beta-hydroxysteroid- dehydrogenase/decarboxylase n=1 Tax=Ipomoea triloba TaxID=35885 RepID=UPI00125D554F|nr:3beta-hydroxysteroid-dehydrogenase/decarboxylase [Ipomoea triloba]
MVAGGEKWSVVTGGRGFAARHLVEMLIRYNMFSVRVADLGPEIKLEPHEEHGTLGQALRSGRAVYVSMDLRDKSQVLKAFEGAEAVFHMAAPDSSINNYQLHHSVNVQGTKNVIDACVELKVKRLIYTSSPSVVFDGVHGIFNGDESMPYPAKHNDSYSATKAEGEALVLKANGINGLLTCCIRPSSIFGPGDRLLVPSLVTAARAGKSKFIIGDGNNMYDFTYVENVAHGHICAERALASEGAVAEKAAGQAYFITNTEPIKFWEFVSLILEGLGYERPSIKIPACVMMPIAHLVELTYKLLGPYGMKVPQLTPSRIRLLSRSRTFSCSKANDRLGYTPIVPLQEGLSRTIDSYPHLRAEIKTRKDGPSKASILLGNGRVADTLLWRDKRQTLITALVLAAIYFNFIAVGYTMITATSKLLLVASIFLFIHGKLPQKIFGYKIEKIPESKFIVSEEMSLQVAGSVASLWNSAVNSLKLLCRGTGWVLFLKVVSSLLILSILGTFSLRSLFVIVLPIAFVAFVVYEKKEEEIDHFVHEAISRVSKLKSNIVEKVPISSKKTQ